LVRSEPVESASSNSVLVMSLVPFVVIGDGNYSRFG
jgi:hypothetical protein